MLHGCCGQPRPLPSRSHRPLLQRVPAFRSTFHQTEDVAARSPPPSAPRNRNRKTGDIHNRENLLTHGHISETGSNKRFMCGYRTAYPRSSSCSGQPGQPRRRGGHGGARRRTHHYRSPLFGATDSGAPTGGPAGVRERRGYAPLSDRSHQPPFAMNVTIPHHSHSSMVPIPYSEKIPQSVPAPALSPMPAARRATQPSSW